MQTHSLTNEAFAALGGPDLVYVRGISGAEVLAVTPKEALNGMVIDPSAILYAVHRADGARLAVLGDRDSAYAAALAHELVPVSVH